LKGGIIKMAEGQATIQLQFNRRGEWVDVGDPVTVANETSAIRNAQAEIMKLHGIKEVDGALYRWQIERPE